MGKLIASVDGFTEWLIDNPKYGAWLPVGYLAFVLVTIPSTVLIMSQFVL